LDALRGIAAVAVMLHHYTGRYPQITRNPLDLSFRFPDGHFGVDLFFIISGFVIPLTLHRTRDLYEFVASRVGRLWPAYLACMALTATIVAQAHVSWGAPFNQPTILANMTMMPELFDRWPIDGSYWSLFFELVFYVLAAAGFFLARGRGTEVLCLCWLLSGIAVRLWMPRSPVGFSGVQLETYLALRFAPLFVIGVMFQRIRSGQSVRAAWAVLAAAWACSAFGPPYRTYRPIPNWGYFLLVGALALAVWIGTMERSPLSRVLPLLFLGDISYPLYLCHQNLGYLVILKLTRAGLGPNLSVLITITFAILLATALHYLIEKPGQKGVRWLFARARQRYFPVATQAKPEAL
jgi:peptidoglycan/LPS O-acetylase OafA/YrhL